MARPGPDAEGSSDLKQRLRRLRREAEPSQAPEARATGMPTWLKTRLARDEQRRRRATGGGPSELVTERLCPASCEPPAEIAEEQGPRGSFAARTTLFARDHHHGQWQLDEIEGAFPRVFERLTGDPDLGRLDLARAVYLDTETTGLSGGAGIFVYMVGLGRFTERGFELWQGFLRGPEEEPALLAEVARRVGQAQALVSFFGKSFDRHRLEDKMRMRGVEPTFETRPHLDLYHPLRRIHGGVFEDARLATLERELCGLEREDDLPGSMAPAAWMDYLAGRAHRLEGVFRHNRDDVLSLATLAAWLGRVEEDSRMHGWELSGPSLPRARALARAAHERGDHAAALAYVQRGLEQDPRQRELHARQAELLRRLGRHQEACQAFEQVCAVLDEHTAPALVAWSKLLEHRLKDPAAALERCRRARAALEAVSHAERVRLTRDLEQREQRLAKKS